MVFSLSSIIYLNKSIIIDTRMLVDIGIHNDMISMIAIHNDRSISVDVSMQTPMVVPLSDSNKTLAEYLSASQHDASLNVGCIKDLREEKNCVFDD